ncbi:MAG: extracellular solute-binding protein [Betaproteobacteria bacterium]
MTHRWFKGLVVAVVMAILVLSSTAGLAKAPVTIRALFMEQASYSAEDIKAMTRDFEAKNPGIKVELTFVPFEALHDKTVASGAAGVATYDVVLVDSQFPPEFATAGFVLDVTKRVPAEYKKGVFAPVMDMVEFRGKIYGLPWVLDTKYFFYNTDMLKKAGFTEPPKTWDEAIDQAKAIKAKGLVKYPFVWSWAQAEALVCDYIQLTHAFGGTILDQNDNPAFHRGGGLEALKFMVRTLDEGLTNPASIEFLEEDVRKTFSAGDAAFALNWVYMYNLANDPKEAKVAGKVGMTISPGTKGIKSASVNGSMLLSVMKNSKHPNEAFKYIAYLTSRPVQEKYAALSLPIWTASYEDPKLVKELGTLIAAAKEQYKYMHSKPKVVWYNEMSTVLQVALQNALTKKMTPEKALDDAAKKVAAIKAKYAKK